MHRRSFLKTIGATAGAAALPLPSLAQFSLGSGSARRAAFEAALAEKPWLRAFSGIDVSNLSGVMRTLHGKVPEGLRGHLFRNGPAKHDLGGERFAHWFDAPGMIQKFTLNGDGAFHQGRIIETARNRQELAADQILFDGFGDGGRNSGGSADGQNTGNISLTCHNEELLALWEGGSPHLIDPETLETQGTKTWSPQTAGLPFSAHPRHDTEGNLWSVGYSADPAVLIIQKISPGGELAGFQVIPQDATAMVHDFALTPSKLIVVLPPFLADQDAGQGFLSRFTWHGSRTTRVLVFDRADLGLVQEFELPAFWLFHFGNAYETAAGTLVCDFIKHEDVGFMTHDGYAVMDGSWHGHATTGMTYAQLDLNLMSGKAQIQILPELGKCEFLKTNPRTTLQNHRHTLMLAEHDEAPGFGKVVLYDRQTDRAQIWQAPSHCMLEEHMMVPDAKGHAPWILGTGFDWTADTTWIAVYSSLALNDGPVFQAEMECVLPFGLHGYFLKT